MAKHLEPQNCYVCGGGPHEPTESHKFWTNADAEKEFDRQPEPDYSPEAAYVEWYRPY